MARTPSTQPRTKPATPTTAAFGAKCPKYLDFTITWPLHRALLQLEEDAWRQLPRCLRHPPADSPPPFTPTPDSCAFTISPRSPRSLSSPPTDASSASHEVQITHESDLPSTLPWPATPPLLDYKGPQGRGKRRADDMEDGDGSREPWRKKARIFSYPMEAEGWTDMADCAHVLERETREFTLHSISETSTLRCRTRTRRSRAHGSSLQAKQRSHGSDFSQEAIVQARLGQPVKAQRSDWRTQTQPENGAVTPVVIDSPKAIPPPVRRSRRLHSQKQKFEASHQHNETRLTRLAGKRRLNAWKESRRKGLQPNAAAANVILAYHGS